MEGRGRQPQEGAMEALRAGSDVPVISRALQDSQYRQRLLEDPKGTIEDTLGIKFADEVTIQVHEADDTTAHMVLPSTRDIDSELESEETRGQQWSGYQPAPYESRFSRYRFGDRFGVLSRIPPGLYDWA